MTTIGTDKPAVSLSERDRFAAKVRPLWMLREDVAHLNHGSFGAAPKEVLTAQAAFTAAIATDPIEFLARRSHELLDHARETLAAEVGCQGDDLLLVENATTGMNMVAQGISLAAGDQVLLTDQEYGAVRRIWEHHTQQAGARLVTAKLPFPATDEDSLVGAFLDAVTARTKLAVFSHITSPTATIFPVERLVRECQIRGIITCIDGPHALAALPLDLIRLGCDFYTASCHKWLCAATGSGFLYVKRELRHMVRPVIISWGETPGAAAPSWRDEFQWSGTRNPAAFLTIPTALAVLKREIGLDAFREHAFALARYARQEVVRELGLQPVVPDDRAWYATMIGWILPPGPVKEFQAKLRDRHLVEVPIVPWQGGRLVRASCHAYTSTLDITRLVMALKQELLAE